MDPYVQIRERMGSNKGTTQCLLEWQQKSQTSGRDHLQSSRANWRRVIHVLKKTIGLISLQRSCHSLGRASSTSSYRAQLAIKSFASCRGHRTRPDPSANKRATEIKIVSALAVAQGIIRLLLASIYTWTRNMARTYCSLRCLHVSLWLARMVKQLPITLNRTIKGKL